MREIKFRGKRLENGEWVYGDLTRYSENMSYITVDLVGGEIYEVEPDTVGQYTELKDSNGYTDIYEGDIIDIEGNIRGNIYEAPKIIEGTTDFIIQGFGTKNWNTTYQKAMDRGCQNS